MQENKIEEYRSKHAFLDQLENVKLNFGPVNDHQIHPLEQVYMYNIFKELSSWSRFSTHQFLIIGANAPWDFNINSKSVIFYLSNEDHIIPNRLLQAKAIFTPYCPLENCPANCFSMPLGYNGSLSELSMTTINEREFDVFFSGNLHRRRISFYLNAQHYFKTNDLKALVNKNKKTNNSINFTRSFGGGLPPDLYSSSLMNSKIALVPEGYLSNNSFRFFEACKYGNVIITKKLYDYWFYKEFPGIQLNNWIGLKSTIRNLLKNPEEIENIHKKTLRYYHKFCTELSVAGYIIERLQE